MPWLSLGVLAPGLLNWRTFRAAKPLAAGAAVFRVRPSAIEPGHKFKTYALVRFKAVIDGDLIYTPTRRIYPRSEPIVIEAPIPREVRGSGVEWRPEILKKIYRNFRGRNPEPKWRIEIEEFVRVNVAISELQFDSELTTIDREDLTMDITNVEGID
jgi:hypothetical protein